MQSMANFCDQVIDEFAASGRPRSALSASVSCPRFDSQMPNIITMETRKRGKPYTTTEVCKGHALRQKILGREIESKETAELLPYFEG